MPRRDRPQDENRGGAGALVAALANPKCYDEHVAAVRVVETHISWVFLTGTYAYKVKQPVKLPFVDFSTLELRKRFCDEELRLNRRLAPEIYVDVVPIGGTPSAPKVGTEPAIEYAIKMRQFPDGARLDRLLEAGKLPADALPKFARHLSEFHDGLPALQPPPDSAADTTRAALGNLDELRDVLRGPELDALRAVHEWTQRESERIRPTFARRATDGRHRECHGDLHLENLLLLDGRVVAFDALEFDAKLREIDVASETSFVAMDLLAHGRADLAYQFLNAYLETGGDYGGVGVLRFYLVQRALVRAKVRAIKAAQKASEAGRDALAPYLELAAELVKPRQPLLAITHGLSGSGKTHVTGQLIGRVPALRVRSDLERKRLAGLEAQARSGSAVGAGLYGREAGERTYERLAEVAATALAADFDIIVDAAFLARAERARFRAVAAAAGARFAILDCRAPEAELRRRIEARSAQGKDASEADSAVLDHQLATQEPLAGDELVAAVNADTASRIDYAALAAELARR